MRFFLFILASGLQAQTWAAISPTGYGLVARGFNNKLPWDSVNHEMLYFGGPPAVSSIYSSVIAGYKTTTKSWTLRINNGATAEHCPQEGSPYNGFNPTTGHPNGFFWYDALHGSAETTNQLCMNQFDGHTYFYRSATVDMGTVLAKAPFGTGDGTFNATGVNFQNIDWISGINKAFFCCYKGSATNPFYAEFDGSSTWIDVTSMVTGTQPPMPLTAAATMSDGTNLWVLAGCNGTAPGNFSPNLCSGAGNTNDLFKYVASTRVFSKIAPVGGVKPPTTNGSFPFAYYRHKTNQIIYYGAGGTNDLWIYDIATNTWNEYTTSGGFAIPTMGSVGGDGNMCQDDPDNDIGVCMYPVNGGGSPPLVYHLTFPAGMTGSGQVTISGKVTQ